MLTYHFDRLQDDGSWFGYDFTAPNDDDAVTHALRKRTSNRCELYQGARSLATFDGVTEKEEQRADDVRTDPLAPEPAFSDVIDQYRKMASKARSDGAAASLPNVRHLHLQSAKRLEDIVLGLESVAHAKVRNENAKREAVWPD